MNINCTREFLSRASLALGLLATAVGVMAATETNAPAVTASTNAVVAVTNAARSTVAPVTNAPAKTNVTARTATASNAPVKIDLAVLKTINDRNIFNRGRYAGSVATDSTNRVAPRITDKFALTGTFTFGRGTFAFFSGTRPEFQKELKVGDTIADHKLTEISHSGVTLVEGTNTIQLKVGMQLARSGNGEWLMSEATEASSMPVFASTERSDDGGVDRRGRNRDSNGSNDGGFNSRRSRNFGGGGMGGEVAPMGAPTTTAPSSPPPSAAEVDEVMKKLIQAREQETK